MFTKYAISAASPSEQNRPPETKPGGLFKKVSQSSRLGGRESIEIRFLRRRVRRKKHPARKRSVAAPPQAAVQGAERSETLSSVCQMGKLMKDYSARR